MTRLVDHAREMRRAATPSEARLWSWLRDRRFDGLKFRRQVPVDRYVLDFYCAEIRLAIEVDGRHHETAWMNAYDSARLVRLREYGIEVLRIPNDILMKDPQLAAEQIRWAVQRVR